MSKLILFNKPFNVLSQFSGEDPSITLSGFINTKQVYPAGRLDKDSEGLLLLTDDGNLQQQISDPSHKMLKTYWVQVEGIVTQAALLQLRKGVLLNDGMTKSAAARLLQDPDIWPRNPPIRERKNIPTCWIELTIGEGRNRQVRRMTAAVGFPTLRLVRWQIGEWTLDNLESGEHRLVKI